MMTFEFSDVVSIIAAVVSMGLTVYVVRFTRSEARKKTVLHMHELWSSESYRKARVNSYTSIASRNDAPILYSTLQGTGVVDDLGTVEHFFGDLNLLMEKDEVDKTLAAALFGPTIQAFYDDVFSKLEYDVEGEKDFFNRRMKTLPEKLVDSE